MAKKMTLKEIAAIAGVSVSTVSKALNKARKFLKTHGGGLWRWPGPGGIIPARPTGRSGREKPPIVGFLVPDVANPYFARLWHGVEDIARSQGYSVVTCNTGEDPELELQQLDMLQRLNVAGMLTVPHPGGALIEIWTFRFCFCHGERCK